MYEGDEEHSLREGRSVSRREFLKIAGIAGATIGIGAGVGSLVGACGEEAETTTTAAAATTTSAGATTTTAAASTTTVSAAAEMGREVKIGFVTPLTGGLASFGVPDKYCVVRAQEAIGDGIVCGDGQKHPVTIVTTDSQSDVMRASQVTGDLINNSKVDMVVAASTPDTCNPVADQCEANQTPCLTADCPWQSYIGDRAEGDMARVFDWTYHVFWGAEDQAATYLNIFSQVTTNMSLGAMYPNDADGNALRPIYIPAFEEAGYTVTDGSGFQNGTEDFTTQIGSFKAAGCEVGTGIFIPPDFTNFWKQSAQQGWTPKVATWAKCLLFPQSVNALGEIANGLTCEVWWSPNHPFTSGLLNETCQEFAADYEARQDEQWTQPLLHFVVLEWAVDVLTRTTNVDDKNAIMTAVKGTKLETIAGPLDFTAPVEPAGPPWKVGPCHVVENVYKSPLVGGQWRTATKYPFDLTIVENVAGPMITVQDKVQPYTGF
jgi:branched-chain amino acid transport system substrate-binding protein